MGERQHSLADWHVGKHVVDQMRDALRHPAAAAARTEPAPLAGKLPAARSSTASSAGARSRPRASRSVESREAGRHAWPESPGHFSRSSRAGWVRKNVVMDQRKLDAARRALGVDTETEAIDLALDFVAFRREVAEGIAAMRRVGGIEDVFESRRRP